MNVRQYKKKTKKYIEQLKSDNDFMRRIIANNPTMQEFYDVYTQPLKMINSNIVQFKEYRAMRYLPDDVCISLYLKREIANELCDIIKHNIVYEIDNKCKPPIVTGSIFIGRK